MLPALHRGLAYPVPQGPVLAILHCVGDPCEVHSLGENHEQSENANPLVVLLRTIWLEKTCDHGESAVFELREHTAYSLQCGILR